MAMTDVSVVSLLGLTGGFRCFFSVSPPPLPLTESFRVAGSFRFAPITDLDLGFAEAAAVFFDERGVKTISPMDDMALDLI